MKLRLGETEEMRRQKLEELQALERAHLEYFNTKRRMEADIKDLLSNMEATKRSLSLFQFHLNEGITGREKLMTVMKNEEDGKEDSEEDETRRKASSLEPGGRRR
ncbi:hypothetical protein Ahy_B09g098611 [Arachis hypogaea]|uniref:Oberon coiled-coil region domain-containing protein n=1 Tax=Arachis hypogaea TaxID=3818 RepID=A0A444XSC8_ARAHY|nr:hypothetical protein Ahy_B09g098611 [Arachis hypogaea]